jgi:hypothetical protein
VRSSATFGQSGKSFVPDRGRDQRFLYSVRGDENYATSFAIDCSAGRLTLLNGASPLAAATVFTWLSIQPAATWWWPTKPAPAIPSSPSAQEAMDI